MQHKGRTFKSKGPKEKYSNSPSARDPGTVPAALEVMVDSLPAVVFETNDKGLISYANKTGLEMFGYTEQGLIQEKSLFDLLVHGDRRRAREKFIKCRKARGVTAKEYMAQRKDGSMFPICIHSQPWFSRGQFAGIRGVIVDLSRQKRSSYVTACDRLTGLSNRTFFEDEMDRLENGHEDPVGIIVCDLDGLKLVNDVFGHATGDEYLKRASEVLRRNTRGRDFVARVGGDEFCIILSRVDQAVIMKVVNRIQEAVFVHNSNDGFMIPLYMSIGWAIRQKNHTLQDSLREADKNMYKEKAGNRRKVQKLIYGKLLENMEAKDFIREGHAERVAEIVLKLAGTMKYPESQIEDLKMFAKYHDLGKVGIADEILFKPGPLSEEEFGEVKRHSEIGYRIALFFSELNNIADWILKHHESWNGKGYPLGIQGEDIPLECRILSIADAYDTMTSLRPYRNPLSPSEAIKELKRLAGERFDPELVDKFMEVNQSPSSQ